MPPFRSLSPETPEAAQRRLLVRAGLLCAPLLAEALQQGLGRPEELSQQLAGEAQAMVQIGVMLARHRELVGPFLEMGGDELQASIRRRKALVATATGVLCSSLLRQGGSRGIAAADLDLAYTALREFAAALELSRAETCAAIGTLWRGALQAARELSTSAAGRATAEALQALAAHCGGRDTESLPAMILQVAEQLSPMALPVGCGSPE